MKMIKISNLLLIGLVVCCAACKDSASEKETPNGFKFKVIEKGDGIVAKPTQVIAFNFIIKDSKDSIWANTYDSGMPAIVQVPDSSTMANEIGMNQAFTMFSVPDSIQVTRPANKFFKEVFGQQPPPGTDSTQQFTINIRVVSIMDMQKVAEFQQSMMKNREGSQKAKDLKAIDEYLAKNSIKAEQDTSGVRFVMHSNGSGKKPGLTDCVEVKYKGRFMADGLTFDKNDKMAFRLNEVIRGWTLSVPKLGIGDSATFYIPSTLAYGARGIPGAIPPDAIMIFDVTLLNIGSEFDPENRVCK
jgi:FKBP-type peptidyl-prolyl cis-trans isomerase FkpA